MPFLFTAYAWIRRRFTAAGKQLDFVCKSALFACATLRSEAQARGTAAAVDEAVLHPSPHVPRS